MLTVFGAGGNRDRAKRPLMGAAAARLADVTVVTSDNPRSEDPLQILAAVEEGARAVVGGAEIVVEPDRHEAIHRAVALAADGDTVVVAGKGHEAGQEVSGAVLPFDDRLVPLIAQTDGVLYARHWTRFATAGMLVARIAGEGAARKGDLLVP